MHNRRLWLTVAAAVIFLIAAAPVSAERAGAAFAALVVATVVRAVYRAIVGERRSRPFLVPSLFLLAALFSVLVTAADS